ncbi:HtaA domain-containing protein [Streptomyces sp. NBC_00287]|uniref:HtaA domain-containing protein n=1 Tax=Streptomyces sp. NBC_00287 TaxID=2975702 RepID=UPI002E2C1B0B|nr:HtaA domain-containing protein [Streptomyces sp. NBC_00287]
MAKRPGAAVVAGGALLALLGQGTAQAQETQVSGGYASWTLDGGELTLGGSARPAWFQATSGSADPETGDADIELGGTTQLVPSTDTVPPLTLAGLRLRLDGDSGALHTRTAVDGQARELTLAEVKPGETVVRSGGLTWTGLEATLTDEGAALLSQWSGREFASGDGLGRLDVTVGTGVTETTETPEPTPSATTPAPQKTQSATVAPPKASVTSPELPAGSEQTATGEGFQPGEVILVAIDQDTRYQVTADEQGRASLKFPVYVTAVEGEHTVELYSVSGERHATAGFGVRKP